MFQLSSKTPAVWEKTVPPSETKYARRTFGVNGESEQYHIGHYLSAIGFGLFLTLLCLRAYRYPEYSTDGFEYMGNAVAMSGASIREIHDSVYREAKAGIPQSVYNHLTGADPAASAAEERSFRDRLINPYHFSEFLPCFAIRPVFNELLYVFHFKFGMELLRASVLIPVVAYWLTGWLIWSWMSRYTAGHWAALMTALLVLSSPLLDSARSTTPDALSSLVVLLGLYLMLEREKLLPGTILLLASVFVRTDNVLIVVPALAFMLADRKLSAAEGIFLSALALLCVAIINHFAGDYGPRMLYYRSFIEPPVAIGEITPTFGMGEYLAALRTGFAGAIHADYIPFTLMGLIGLLRRPSPAILGLALTTTIYTAVHLIVFPNPEMRFFGPFFAGMGLTLASTLPEARVVRRPRMEAA